MESVAKVFKEEKEHLTTLKKKEKNLQMGREGWMIQRDGWGGGVIEEEWGASFFLGSHLNDQQ